MSMSFHEHTNEILNASLKAAPAVAGATYAGMTASDVAGWLTAIYVAIQIFLLLPKLRERLVSYWRKLRGKQE